MKVRVNVHAQANASVDVEVTDEELHEIADEYGIDVADVTPDMLGDVAGERAFHEVGMPTLCAHCAGWGQKYSVDIVQWEPDEQDYVTLAD